MRLGSMSPHHRSVQPVLFCQTQGVRIYQGEQHRTTAGSMAAIYRMLDAIPVASCTAGIKSY